MSDERTRYEQLAATQELPAFVSHCCGSTMRVNDSGNDHAATTFLVCDECGETCGPVPAEVGSE